MYSDFSSTKAYCDSVKSPTSTTQSRPGSVSEPSSLASKHSKTSKSSSMSSKIISTTSSNRSAGSSSKSPSQTSSKYYPKPSHKSKFTLEEVSTNERSYVEPTQSTLPPIRRYAASQTHSNPHYASSTTTMTEVEYQARMQAVLDDIDPHLDLNGPQMNFYDTQVDRYDTQLDLDEDGSDKSYDPTAHS